MSLSPRVHARLVPAVLLSLVLVAASCSSNPDVEAVDSTSTVDEGNTTSADNDSGGDDDVAVEGESTAMGEDDDDAAPATTEPADDGATQTTVGAALDDPELAAALAAGQDDALKLPFMYITADQDCDGCAETVSLYYVPSEEKASILTLSAAYVDGEDVGIGAVDPFLSIADPRLVAEQLAALEDPGVQYSVDTVSGLITSWTVDGNTVTLRCLQVDTRPVDLRSEVCRDSLIG